MPAWKSRFLREAIASIVAQTSPDWELVVVDDCSPEPLREVVESFQDPRIRYVRNEQNLGGENLVRQWNHAITFAQGDYIVLAADDDIYKPSFCETVLQLAEKYPQVDLIHSSVEQIDEEGAVIGDDNILPEFTNKYAYLNWWVTGRVFTCVGNFAFRRSALLEMGGFIDTPCGFASDIETPIVLSRNGVANTSSMLFCFRISRQHLSSDKSRFKEKLEAISQRTEWMENLGYEEPQTPEDSELYHSVINHEYLHRKAVYEYLHLVIKHLPAREVPAYLKLCRLATPKDKLMIGLRWMKNKMLR